jgi:hypothetical protein
MRRSWCRRRNLVTQASETFSSATLEAEVRIIVLVGASPLYVKSPIYRISSNSWCGLSFCWLVFLSSTEVVGPLHLLLNTALPTPNLSAYSLITKRSRGSCDSIATIASSIGAMLVKLQYNQEVVLRLDLVFGVLHGHRTRYIEISILNL